MSEANECLRILIFGKTPKPQASCDLLYTYDFMTSDKFHLANVLPGYARDIFKSEVLKRIPDFIWDDADLAGAAKLYESLQGNPFETEIDGRKVQMLIQPEPEKVG